MKRNKSAGPAIKVAGLALTVMATVAFGDTGYNAGSGFMGEEKLYKRLPAEERKERNTLSKTERRELAQQDAAKAASVQVKKPGVVDSSRVEKVPAKVTKPVPSKSSVPASSAAKSSESKSKSSSVVKPTPSVSKPAPSVTKPTQSVTPPAPSVTEPTPSVTQPAPSVTKPTPSITQPAPSVDKPTPSVTQPAPSVTKPAPSVTQSQPAVSSTETPKETNPPQPVEVVKKGGKGIFRKGFDYAWNYFAGSTSEPKDEPAKDAPQNSETVTDSGSTSTTSSETGSQTIPPVSPSTTESSFTSTSSETESQTIPPVTSTSESIVPPVTETSSTSTSSSETVIPSPSSTESVTETSTPASSTASSSSVTVEETPAPEAKNADDKKEDETVETKDGKKDGETQSQRQDDVQDNSLTNTIFDEDFMYQVNMAYKYRTATRSPEYLENLENAFIHLYNNLPVRKSTDPNLSGDMVGRLDSDIIGGHPVPDFKKDMFGHYPAVRGSFSANGAPSMSIKFRVFNRASTWSDYTDEGATPCTEGTFQVTLTANGSNGAYGWFVAVDPSSELKRDEIDQCLTNSNTAFSKKSVEVREAVDHHAAMIEAILLMVAEGKASTDNHMFVMEEADLLEHKKLKSHVRSDKEVDALGKLTTGEFKIQVK
ncbi:hypothetical protein [Parendozoicomonas haliclonae]|uniref:Uncharacterized protein n=1 Tax=Parendozoicomonas haliclonae TaxID=1960125 RepID=A0A1X7AJU2_9GAMM|nr:hypothetical protein [Parendozoicomonas haliclonae]SMA46039.1 hypothetical protein EHSB41UT_02068 [Parendozoicomonas haliclonae]